jgi:dynactin complex subunit
MKYEIVSAEMYEKYGIEIKVINSDENHQYVHMSLVSKDIVKSFKREFSCFESDIDFSICQKLIDSKVVQDVVKQYVETLEQDILTIKKNFNLLSGPIK